MQQSDNSSRSERISQLINQYLTLISSDHHKTKDGYFYIEKTWAGYDSEEVIPMYVASHPGYLNDFVGPKRYTEKSAEEDMINFLEEIIRDWKPADWGDWE